MAESSTVGNKMAGRALSPSATELRYVLNFLELLAVLICIPLAYILSGYIISNIYIPFHEMEFKLILFRYLNYFNYSWQFDIVHFILFSGMIVVSWFVLSYLTSIARLPRNNSTMTVVFSFLRGNLWIFLILIAFKFIFFLSSIPVIFIITYVLLSMLATLVIRLISINAIRIYRAKGYDMRHILVIADDQYTGIIDKLLDQKEWGYKIHSILTDSELVKMKYGNDSRILPTGSDIASLLENNVIDEVFLCKSGADRDEIRSIAKICDEIGVVFRVQSCRNDLDPVQISLKTINNKGKLPLVDIPSLRLPFEVKTITDSYLSIIAVVLLSPLFLLVSLLIKIDSKGPVFFSQERIGLRGRKFRLYKFRTMVANAEELLEKLRENNEMDGPTFKMKDDPRITRIGRFLRKTGLDELPQLINVIKGEMSLIGPRPPLEKEVSLYERWQLRRLSVKPGITCSWQIMPRRNDIKFNDWMNMDLNYIDNWSLSMDARLFVKTVATLFLAQGR